MSNLLGIRTNVRSNWPTEFYSSEITDPILDGWINRAQRKLCRRHNLTFMEQEIQASTVDSQRRYQLPEADAVNGLFAFKSEISCELIDHDNYRVPLTKLFKPIIEIKKLFKDVTDTGIPSHYCIQNGFIELWCLPDHNQNNGEAWTINFEFYGYLNDLSGNTDSNALTVQYPEILEYDATAQGFRFAHDKEKADEWQEKADEVTLELIDEDNTRAYGNIECGLEPLSGQSLGDEGKGYVDLKAHYA